MTMQDIAAIHKIECAANRFPWSQKNFSDSLDSGHYAWIYRQPDCKEIVGYAVVQFILDEAHLLNICVEPTQQGNGYGRVILKHLIEYAKTRDSNLMVLEVRRSNQRAQNLYLQEGFNEMSVRAGYYPAEKGREDAILMGLDLSDTSIFPFQD
jgi:ribosomal-protein-alanine N-acetyltransferase